MRRTKALVLVILFWASAAHGAYTEFYVQTTGSNLNAGSTTSDTAAFTYTSAVLAGGWNSATGVFTVASGNPSGDGVAVGDFASVYVTAGATVATFVARVTARDATTITVSLTAKSGTAPTTDALGATTIKIGGAWKGPNAAESFPFGFITAAQSNSSGDVPRVNFKSGTTYAITAAMTHSIAGPVRFQGYTTSVADGGKATIDGGTSGASYLLLSLTGANNDIVDFVFQNNGATGSSTGFSMSGVECVASRIVVNSVRGVGIGVGSTGGSLIESEAYGCNQNNGAASGGINLGTSPILAIRCISHDNTSGSNADGFTASNGATLVDCISESNTGKGFAITSTNGFYLINCDAYNNTSDGINFSIGTAMGFVIENCNFIKNGGWGINSSGSAILRNGLIRNCGFGAGTQANTSGQVLTTITGVNIVGSVTYANDVTPWVDPANGDFRINLATSKGTGLGSFTQTAASYTGTISYPDIGAAQHLDSGSLKLPSINE